MPRARGNQPMSTGSNYNQSKNSKTVPPRKNKSVRWKKGKKSSYDNKQTSKINTLSKQVYKLQMASYGRTQMNFQSLERVLIPTAIKPLCFDLTDFTCLRAGEANGCNIFQHVSGSTATTVSHFLHNATVADNYYWRNQNKDQPDGGAYLAMNATYFVQVRGSPHLDNVRVRFDVVSQKPGAIIARTPTDPDPNKLLPDTLSYLKHICEPHINRINPVFFKKYFSKICFVNSTKSGPNKGTTGNVQRFSFTIRPNKVCVQNETNPLVGGYTEKPIPPSTLPAPQQEFLRGNFGPNNVAATQPLWIIISTDDQASGQLPGQDQVEISISRRITWRDSLGSGNL